MIEVKTTDELRQILLGDKEEFIGKVIVDASGLKYVIIGIDEAGVKSVPIDFLIDMKEKDLQKYFNDTLSPDKAAAALSEVHFYKKDIQQLYG